MILPGRLVKTADGCTNACDAKNKPFRFNIHHGVVVGFGDVPEHGFLFDAAVVHQHIECRQLLDGSSRNHTLPSRDISDVGFDDDAFAAARRDLGQHRVGTVGVAHVVNGDARSFFGIAQAMPLPMPRLLPVINATLSFNRMVFSLARLPPV